MRRVCCAFCACPGKDVGWVRALWLGQEFLESFCRCRSHAEGQIRLIAKSASLVLSDAL